MKLRSIAFGFLGLMFSASVAAGQFHIPRPHVPTTPRLPSQPRVPTRPSYGSSYYQPARPGTIGINNQSSGPIRRPSASGPTVINNQPLHPAQPGTLNGLNLKGAPKSSPGFILWDPIQKASAARPSVSAPLGTSRPGTIAAGNAYPPPPVLHRPTTSPTVVAPPVLRPSTAGTLNGFNLKGSSQPSPGFILRDPNQRPNPSESAQLGTSRPGTIAAGNAYPPPPVLHRPTTSPTVVAPPVLRPPTSGTLNGLNLTRPAPH